MKTESSALELTKELTLGVKNREESYKGFMLVINLMHCGMAGKYWLMTVQNKKGETLTSFTEDSYCATLAEATQYIDHQLNQ